MKNKFVAIILGRKGSKGVPDKNVMEILGRPAFIYSFLAAKNSKYVDQIFVTTDHDEIIEKARINGLSVITRPVRLCTDDALFEDALVHAYYKVKERIGGQPKYVVVLMCNAVTVSSQLIDTAIIALENDPLADSAVTVSIFNMYSPVRARKKTANDGYLVPFVPFEAFGDPKTLNCDRGSQGDAYFADMSHSVCRSRCLENIDTGLLPQRWMGKKIIPIPNQYGCDIDDPWQIDMSVRWLKAHGFSKTKTPY
tara:strand:+ start:642 stop:1400 length:759 start_codon:yes stop_codon:yes gene_type:complete